MKTITKTYNIYNFDELSDKAKQKAIDNLRDINTDYNWWDSVYEYFKQFTEYFGVDVDLNKTYFTGFYQQGQGSAYTADVDVLKMIDCIKHERWKEYAPNENIQFEAVTKNIDRICKLISKNHIEYKAWVHTANRETNISVGFECYINTNKYHDNIAGELCNFESLIDDACKELNKFLFRSLQNEYDYRTSDEAIKETIKGNDYTFDEHGKMINE